MLGRLLIAVTFVFGLAACDSGPAVTAPCRTDSNRIVIGECLLGLTVDSDSADVVRRLGPADRYLVGNEGFGFRYLDYFDHPVGGRVIVALAPRGLYSVSFSDGFTAVTDDEIGFGTPRLRVRRLLGSPDASAGELDDSGFDRYEFPSDSVEFQISYTLFGGTQGVEGVMLRTRRDVF